MQKHILNDSNTLNKEVVSKINIAFLEAKQLVEKSFGLVFGVDVVFALAPEWIIPELGFGARVFSSHFILISLDSLNKFDKNEMKYSICHEINHVIRVQALGEKSFFIGSRLIDGIIAEGMQKCLKLKLVIKL